MLYGILFDLISLTWYFRWYQNKQVQKVVKDSKIMGKVRTQIKLKDFKLKPSTTTDEVQPTAAKEDGSGSGSEKKASNEELPKIIGSLEEYAKITGNANQNNRDEAKEDASEDESESEEEGEDGDLWGAIMGGDGS